MRVVVTGGAGKAGRAVVSDLSGHGLDVLSVDLVRSAQLDCEQLVADLTDYGQANFFRGMASASPPCCTSYIGDLPTDVITMTSNDGTRILSTPSHLDSLGDFTTTWEGAG